MNVMYTCDNNYIWLMGISTISLFENNKDIEELKVFLLGENISQENKERLKDIGNKYDRDVEVIDIPKIHIPTSLVSARWPLSAFTRLFSGMILPTDIKKILYLDCDTIITGNISEIEHIEFNGNIAMGVKDCISGTYKKNIGLDKNSPYINAGVILFNMDALRKVDICEKIENYMNKYVKLIHYADQDILNGMFKGKIGELSPEYNVMTIDIFHAYEEIKKLRRPTNFYSQEELENAKLNPLIIHYTTNMRVIRPWFSNTNHPFANEFKKYIGMSAWMNKKLEIATFNSTEAKLISVILKLPKTIAFETLGLIHAELRPRYIKMRAKK
ncbi:glycosyltransferase family 8 protein [uncultured Eubacterium sp.]|uniref:glycosyltransferase family 8 protein n=1 Tax=uncultured Eubacterium sp. TaxID=165185 RepID=UPI003267FA81